MRSFTLFNIHKLIWLPSAVLKVINVAIPLLSYYPLFTKVLRFLAQKLKFPIKDFFSFLRIWSHLLKKSLMENFIFCAVLASMLF